MTKKDIANAIAQAAGVSRLQAAAIVQRVLDGIIDTLVTEGRIELRNFGVFEVQRRRPRPARNPRTGERVLVPERFVVTFKPGRAMGQRVRQLGKVPDRGERVLSGGGGPRAG